MAAVGTRYQGPSGNSSGISRLALMQERMRENIRQDKESKMLEMVARRDAEREDMINRVTKTSITSLSSSMNSLSFSNGGKSRVRKMLEERRNNPQSKGYISPKGYDKSYPLDPVNKEGKPPRRGVDSIGRGISVDSNRRNNDLSMARSKSQVTLQKSNRANNRLSNSTRSFDGLKTNNYHKSTSSLMERRSSPVTTPTSTKSSPGHMGSKMRSSWAPTVNKASYAPKKLVTAPKPPPRTYGINRRAVNGNSSSLGSKQQVTSRNTLPPKVAPAKPKPIVKARTPLPASTKKPTSKVPSTEAISSRKNDGMPSCKICGRTFASDRLEKHQQICSKSKVKSKKRKIFDPTKMRTQGTEAEKYIARGDHKKEPPQKKSDWRKKHGDLIQTLRAAKGVQGYVAPPIDTSGYVQCPHCGRKFSEAAADRHIPKCANILSNKKRR